MSQKEVVYIYNYHHETKDLISATPARKSPLEEDVYLIPAHATRIAPPDMTEEQKAVWNGQSWDVVDITQPEPEPEPTLEEIQQTKIIELDSFYSQKIAEGMTYDGNVFQIDDGSRLNMTAVMTEFALGASNPHGGFWRSSDNQMIAMTDAEVKDFITAVKAYVLSLLQAYWTHKDTISDLENAEDIQSYDIEQNWP